MGKGGRSYISLAKNSATYKLYMEDVKTWRQVIKKQTPRLPSYDEVNTQKWEQSTEIEFEPMEFSCDVRTSS